MLNSMLTTTFFSSVFLLIAVGCKRQPLPGPEPMPVQGQVFYQGQPAAGFRVTFHPLFEQGEVKFTPFAVTDEQGAFRLQSYSAEDGAPVGEYAVTFEWLERPKVRDQIDDPDLPNVDRLKGKYNRPDQSTWKVQIQAGPNELEPFRLE
ncbi:MAG TPA: hypothetical protein VHC19_05780 [Pirellulales bacterium]|nr:hypothetical protein [Pirellulales bacterium]